MSLIKMATLILILGLPTMALAQGSGSSRPPAGNRGQSTGPSAFAVTRSLKGTITHIDSERGVIVVQEKKGKRHTLKISENTKFKVGKNSKVSERDFTLSNLEIGQRVNLTYLRADLTVTRLQINTPKANRKG